MMINNERLKLMKASLYLLYDKYYRKLQNAEREHPLNPVLLKYYRERLIEIADLQREIHEEMMKTI